MNIKVLRARLNLSQKDFGERICVTAQTVQKYESGDRNIPETVQKLIRYEFADFLPEEERLISSSPGQSTIKNEDFRKLQDENENLKQQALLAKEHEEYIKLQRRTIELLEDQVKLYKNMLPETDRSKTA